MPRRGTSNSNVRGSVHSRRARRAWLVEQHGWPELGLVCCFRCGVPLLQDPDPEAPGQSVSVDRILPGVLGGTYGRDNIRPCCEPCNTEMGSALGVQRKRAIETSPAA